MVRISDQAPEGVAAGAPVLPDPRLAAAQPIDPQDRIVVLDALRGFALLGILAVNLHDGGFLGGRASYPPALDVAAYWFVQFFGKGKFISLFSFLFGLGLAVQLERAHARGTPFFRAYLRRLAVLLLIGIAHSILFWGGQDILMQYAVLGVPLLLFRMASTRTLLAWSIVFLAFGVVHNRAVTAITAAALAPEPSAVAPLDSARRAAKRAEEVVRVREALRRYRTGAVQPYWETVRIRLQRFRSSHTSVSALLDRYLRGGIFAMFLLGLYAWRRGVFRHTEAQLAFIRRVMWLALTLGLAANAVWVGGRMLGWSGTTGLRAHVVWLAQNVGAPALCLFYIAAIILLARRGARWLAPLAPTGRAALSNYVLQSVIVTTIFFEYGLGLYRRVPAFAGLGLTLVIFAAQLLLSAWWLRRFPFGPLEWLWRTLTYGKLARRAP